MADSFVDLHCHSTASDGTLAPAAVVDLALRSGLVGLALTDHDTIAGIDEAAAAAQAVNLRFLPGIEISCIYPLPGILHLLGYGIDPRSPSLGASLARLIEARDHRNPRMVAKLNEMGVHITMDEVIAAAAGGVVGRPHIAAVLVRKGYVSSIHEAFNRYLGSSAPAFIEKERLTQREALEVIHSAGGLAVLAHPVQLATQNDAQFQRVIKDLIDLGLDGIEVIHTDHDARQCELYERIADRYGLLKTGGSDFHGHNKHDVSLGFAGGRRIPSAWMDELLERLADPHPRPSP